MSRVDNHQEISFIGPDGGEWVGESEIEAEGFLPGVRNSY